MFWRLGEDGFVRVVPQVGTFVAPINVAAVYDSQFVRETLECRAIETAARRAAAADLTTLHTIWRGAGRRDAPSDFPGFFTLDDAMHRMLMELAGRPFVWQVIAGAKLQLDRVRFLSLEESEWPGMIMAQHRELVAAVAERDGKRAVRVMTAHLRTAFAAIGRIAAIPTLRRRRPGVNGGSMEQTWRWFGPADTITLAEIRQTGATGIVTALHDIPYGVVWSREAIGERKSIIEGDRSLGLRWSVVESLPVSRGDQARRRRSRDRCSPTIADRCAISAPMGVDTVCYNFMPVLDWTRTELRQPLPSGGTGASVQRA